MIATTHYLQTREQHFADVVAGGSHAVATQKPAGQCTQKTGSGSVQNSAQISVQSEAIMAHSNSHAAKKNTDDAAGLRDPREVANRSKTN